MDTKENRSVEQINDSLVSEINFNEANGPIEKTSINTKTSNSDSIARIHNTVSIVDKNEAKMVDAKHKINGNNNGIKQKSRKKDKGKNSYIYGFIFIIGAILLEIASFVRLGLGLFPVCFGIEIAIIIMLAGVIFIIPTEPLKIMIMSLFLGVQSVVSIINGCLYKTINELLTVDMMFSLKGEAADAFEWSHVDWLTIGIICAILVFVVILIVFGNKKMPKYTMKRTKTAVLSLLILLFSVEILGFSLFRMSEAICFANAEETRLIDNNKFLYENVTVAKYASLKRFGFWGFYINSFKSFINDGDINNNNKETLKSFITEGDKFKYSNSMFNGENVSGTLEGDNLIVIMMESVEWFAIDPFNTPTLYNFLEEQSIQFTNFYANNKTNISEQISFIGNMPYEKSYNTLSGSVGIDVPNSLPNLFKAEGYEKVNYFHSYSGKIYCRETLNKELGFNNVYALEQSSISNKSESFGDFVDDGDFIDSLKTEFMPKDKKFFSFFTTVTTHGPYDNSNERFESYYGTYENNYSKYQNWVEENNFGYNLPQVGTKEYNLLKEYKSKTMTLDNAMKVILNYLKTNNGPNGRLIDNTSIVLFADHNCYYSDLGFYIKNVKEGSNTSKIYNIPFAIYNKKLGKGKVDTFCTTFDIYSTICDLYGLKFNHSLAQGNSVFSEDISNSVFVSNISGMFDDKYYTRTLDDYTSQDDTIETGAQFEQFKQKLNNFFIKQKQIELYYATNYEKNVK